MVTLRTGHDCIFWDECTFHKTYGCCEKIHETTFEDCIIYRLMTEINQLKTKQEE